MRLVLSGCRRCGGDLFPDITESGEACFLCLQCGTTVRSSRGGQLFPSPSVRIANTARSGSDERRQPAVAEQRVMSRQDTAQRDRSA
jgi:predicted  nucleic acid-binding Zn-ribbon protein